MKLRGLLLGRKAMTNLDSTLKSRDITLPTKVHLVKALVFPIFLYGCESWTVKKAEHWRIYAFELQCWGRLLRVRWTAWRPHQSVVYETSLNIHWKDWYWAWSSSPLATWCEEMTHWKKTLIMVKIQHRKKREWRRINDWISSPAWWVWVWASSRSWWWTGSLACCSPWGCKESDTTEQLNWTEYFPTQSTVDYSSNL